ncbi:MAG: penicillin-binding protein 2 [Methylocystis sp.]|nr:penicillin-binding protein 2 [Methylocystis sp.]MCA3583358.1 penicillin-binding protein 2 [Methylocystis sp.]MCA3589414.1 penicillin-binding protein 2 [Methylocystis sp.]MCA3591877.1 penicillin-binding protein 2 [Methylocystis sp.]
MPGQADPVRLRVDADAPTAKRPGRKERLKSILRDMFSTRLDKSTARLGLVAVAFVGLYGLIGGRLIYLGVRQEEQETVRSSARSAISIARPMILDRNGEMMASDLRTVSIFAEPHKIVDRDEAAELLNAVFPEMTGRELRDRLSPRRGNSRAKFAWIKREVTPAQWAQVHSLGIPGIGVVPENKRVYPNGNVAAHVLGFADLDNVGIAGIEKWIDSQGLNDLKGAGFVTESQDLKPVSLSIDLRVTHAMRDEMLKAVNRYKAKAGAAALMDVDTGEIIAHVSLPDYDPNQPALAQNDKNINRLQVGVFEMGSTFKALSTAMALDSGKYNLNSTLDARQPLRYGKFRIGDFHGKGRVLTVPEVFVYSSNIGTARMALGVGVEGHKAFLRKMGQLDRMTTELPESSMPLVPKNWGELNTMTISFGHGLAVAPLQALTATAALVNGGLLIPPTYIRRTQEEAALAAKRVIKPETSEAMRYVMRLNAEKGSAARANIPGYYVGGKTGTSEKVVRGRYSKEKVLTSFMAVMPADKPRYLLLTMLDEPEGVPETMGQRTSGWNAAPTSGYIIERIAPMLDLTPRFEAPEKPFPVVSRLNPWGMR